MSSRGRERERERDCTTAAAWSTLNGPFNESSMLNKNRNKARKSINAGRLQSVTGLAKPGSAAAPRIFSRCCVARRTHMSPPPSDLLRICGERWAAWCRRSRCWSPSSRSSCWWRWEWERRPVLARSVKVCPAVKVPTGAAPGRGSLLPAYRKSFAVSRRRSPQFPFPAELHQPAVSKLAVKC